MTEPGWARWHPSEPFTVGVEEEVMMLDPEDWTLAQEIDAVLPDVPDGARDAHDRRDARRGDRAGDRPAQLGAEARWTSSSTCAPSSQEVLDGHGLRAAAAGTHPSTVWHETVVSSGHRYQFVYGSMRELARREPTFALHVHVGVDRRGGRHPLHHRLRAHLPLLLARRSTRRSGRAATPAWPPRARRCSRRSRASGSRAASAPTRTTSRPSTCSSAAARSPSPRSCGGTCGPSRASAPSRCGSWTPRRACADDGGARRAGAVHRTPRGRPSATRSARSATRPRSSWRTASWPRATGWRRG